MATFKLVLDKYKKANGKQTIQLRITANRRPIVRSTGFDVLAKDWDGPKERVKASNKNFTSINDALRAKLEQAEREFAEVAATGAAADSRQIADKTFTTHDFYVHAEAVVNAMTGPTEYRTKKGYESTIRAIKAFAPVLLVEQITPPLIEKFRDHLKARELSRSTVIKRLDQFRALYNRSPHKAVRSPFDQVVIGEPKSAKIDPLTVTEISRLWSYRPRTKGERRALDLFLFSYYALGMRIGDVIQMKWDYVKGDSIRYDQTKKEHLESDDVLEFPINRYLDEILSRWPRVSPYVFNTITATDPWKIKKQVESVQASINLTLKAIALRPEVKIDKWMAGKVARRTFADVANKRTGRKVYSVQQAMGHAKISTTEIYLGRDAAAIREVADKTYAD